MIDITTIKLIILFFKPQTFTIIIPFDQMMKDYQSGNLTI